MICRTHINLSRIWHQLKCPKSCGAVSSSLVIGYVCLGADLHLPMDEMVGDQLQGCHLNGTVFGGATLIPGVSGNAISFNGNDQYVDYGRHDSCLTNAGLCSDGITWAFWLYLRAESYAFVVTSGSGFLTDETGFSFAIHGGPKLHIVVKSTDTKWQWLQSGTFLLFEWIHVAMTWGNLNGFTVYINGQEVGGSGDIATDTYSGNSRFNLGRSTGGDKYADVAIDELLVWYCIKPPSFIANIYHAYN